MDPVAAKYLGAGLACIGMGGAAIGVATVFGQFLTGALRNPSAAGGERWFGGADGSSDGGLGDQARIDSGALRLSLAVLEDAMRCVLKHHEARRREQRAAARYVLVEYFADPNGRAAQRSGNPYHEKAWTNDPAEAARWASNVAEERQLGEITYREEVIDRGAR